MKTLAIVIVNYNVKHFLEQCLTSVYKALNDIDAEVFVVDNNSVDGSCELVKKKFPQVILIENKENFGFSKANNQAINLSKAKYVLLLNPDTVVEEDTFSKCLSFMETHSDAGGLGVKMVDGSGRFLPESKRGLPTPWVAFYKIFGLSALFPNSKTFGKYHLTYLDKDKTHEIDVLSGAFMLMRKEALDKSGLLDEAFFMYGEDIDLSYRFQKAGYKNYYFPETSIIHYKGESTKKTSVNYVFVFYNAMIIFAKKHFSSSNAGVFAFLIKMAIYIRASVSIAVRFLKKAFLPLLDMTSLYAGMFFLKTYWENNHKWVPGKYPQEYMLYVVPVYILCWIGFSFFSGAYDKPFKTSKVIKGVFLGAVFISAISNFTDAFRYSKALIILGSIYAVIWLVFSRWLLNSIKNKSVLLDEESDKKVILIGSEIEVQRVMSILKDLKSSINFQGWISTDNNINQIEQNIGYEKDLNEIVSIFRPDELIFCAKDISSGEIIRWMAVLKDKNLDFKIVPDDSNFIIGSNSKNTQGDYYTLDIEFNLNKPEKKRQKRLFDITTAVFVLVLFPILIFTKHKFRNVSFAIKVLFLNYSWVGVSEDNLNKNQSKKPIFVAYSTNESLNTNSVNRLNLLYSKDYTVQKDLQILLKNI